MFYFLRTLGFILLSCFTLSVTGQELIISEDLNIRPDDYIRIIGSDDKTTLLYVHQSGDRKMLYGFSEGLAVKWEREMHFEKKNVEIIGLIPKWEDGFLMLYSFREKGDVILKANKYNIEGEKIDSLTWQKYPRRMITPKSRITYSEDRNRVLVFTNESEAMLDLVCMDLSKMEVQWKSSVAQDMKFKTAFRQIEVANDGSAFIILEKEPGLLKNEEFSYGLRYYDKEGNAFLETSIPFGELASRDAFFVFDNERNGIVGSGIYGEKYGDKQQGIFTIFFDPQLLIFELENHAFTEGLLSEIYGKRVNLKRGVHDLHIQDILLREDGGIVVVSEFVRISENAGESIYRTRTIRPPLRVDYNYEDIILFGIQPDGSFHWKEVLHKTQQSQNDDGRYSSYYLHKNPSNFHLIYNDEIRENTSVSAYITRASGNTKRKSLLNTQYKNIFLRFGDGVQISSDEVLLLSEFKNDIKLVKLKLKNGG